MSRITNKHVLALAAAGAVMLGATAASAQSGGNGIYRNIDPVESSTQVRSRTQARVTTSYNEPRNQSWQNQQNRRAGADAGPFAVPGAAIGAAGAVAGATVAGAGYAAGSLIGAPASTFTGGPYGAYAYSPDYNPYADAARAQHYETPIGDGSLYSAPNGLPMGPQ